MSLPSLFQMDLLQRWAILYMEDQRLGDALTQSDRFSEDLQKLVFKRRDQHSSRIYSCPRKKKTATIHTGGHCGMLDAVTRKKSFVKSTKSFFKIGITKLFCYNNKMFGSINNKTFGCCGKIFGCSNKNVICCP